MARKKSTEDEYWRRYYAATRGRPPRATLLEALGMFDHSRRPCGRRAVDLGCGTGRDTLPLLDRGWHVTAIDVQASALAELVAAVPLAARPRLVVRRARMEHMVLPAADLVNSSFSLFFAARLAQLEALFGQIRRALVPGGRFAGQLLGPNDDWVRARRSVGLAEGELTVLLRGFGLESVAEEETEATTPKGKAKRWHLWHVVARRL